MKQKLKHVLLRQPLQKMWRMRRGKGPMLLHVDGYMRLAKWGPANQNAALWRPLQPDKQG